MSSQLMTMIPPLHVQQNLSPQNFTNLPLPINQPLNVTNNRDSDEKADLKERNRIAAQKWRQKKDQYLGELEVTNDELRKKALDLCSKAESLRIENNVLENELQFFQSFMSKIMSSGPSK